MKKTLAVILSVIMLFSVLPFAGFAADSSYDRAKVAANDAAYIDGLTAEQMASVILDWVDRKIAAYAADAKQGIVDGIIADGFEGFEISAFGDQIAAQIPDITSLDDVIGYKEYLKELGGDFANLDATNLITREAAGSAIGFINGVFQFMADNAQTFGKVFRWAEDEAYPGFDFGKVGEYILSLDTSDPDNKKVVDFYNDYLVGNDIQTKFTSWVAKQMGYTISDGESFDDVINNGIINWFSGLCTKNNILSEKANAELLKYNLKTTDIYTLIKNFVALVQSDNQTKIDTYYNYALDTVVRTMLKTMLGQKATVGAAVAVPAGFTSTYKDIALLKEISGGTVYYQDADKNYYEVTIGADNALTAKTVVWEKALDVNFEAPTATIYTGKDGKTKVAEYRPTSTNYLSADTMPVYMYASETNQALINGQLGDDVNITFTGTDVSTTEYASILSGTPKALDSRFVFEVVGKDLSGNALNIPKIDLDFTAIEAYAKQKALETANQAVASMGMSVTSVDFSLTYSSWSTQDEFVMQVSVGDISAVVTGVPLVGTLTVTKDTKVDAFGTSIDVGSMMTNAVNSAINNPLITVVVDELSGSLDIDDAKALVDYVDTDFVVDSSFIDFAGNYDAYNGVVGQVNHILVGLVNMLLSESGEKDLALVDGDNNNLTANLDKICKKANSMMAAAESVMNDAGLQDMIKALGIDFGSIFEGFDFDLLYKLDFSNVEALLVSAIKLSLDAIDNGKNADITKLHNLVKDCADLDAMAVNVTDSVLKDCVAKVNKSDLGLKLEVVNATGSAKDVIMTKLVAIAYDVASWGVGYLNTTVNNVLSSAETEMGIDLPSVDFTLGVTESKSWQTTLTDLVNRVYDLADGIILACDNSYTDTFDKISAVANAVLPLGSLASNCAKGDFAVDVNTIMTYVFDDALAGDLDGFLGLFETKTKKNDVAYGVSVTEALIKASDHMVDAFFPDTVQAEDYVNNANVDKTTCQEYFTSVKVIDTIAANNMVSVNALKADLVPAVLNLAREAGVLPFFAACEQDHSSPELKTEVITGKAATCTEAGVEDAITCADCGYVISGGKTIAALGHDKHSVTKNATCTEAGSITTTCSRCEYEDVQTIPATGHHFTYTVVKAATCTEEGKEIGKCSDCTATDERVIAKTAHTDANGDNECDDCGAEISSSFGAKIKAFFQKIINWFKGIFGIK